MSNRVEWANAATLDVSRAYRGEVAGDHAVTEPLALLLDNGGSTFVIEGDAGELTAMLTNALYLIGVAQSPQWLVTIRFDIAGGGTSETRVPFVAGGAELAETKAHQWIATLDATGIYPDGFPTSYFDYEVVEVEPLAGDR